MQNYMVSSINLLYFIGLDYILIIQGSFWKRMIFHV